VHSSTDDKAEVLPSYCKSSLAIAKWLKFCIDSTYSINDVEEILIHGQPGLVWRIIWKKTVMLRKSVSEPFTTIDIQCSLDGRS